MTPGWRGVVDLPPPRRVPQIARVTEFDDARGIGAVETGSGRRFAFHCTAITDGSRTIALGTVVAIEVSTRHLGRLEASSVRALPGLAVPGATLETGPVAQVGVPVDGERPAPPEEAPAVTEPASPAPAAPAAPVAQSADLPTTVVATTPSEATVRADEPTRIDGTPTTESSASAATDAPTTVVAPVTGPPAYDWAQDPGTPTGELDVTPDHEPTAVQAEAMEPDDWATDQSADGVTLPDRRPQVVESGPPEASGSSTGAGPEATPSDSSSEESEAGPALDDQRSPVAAARPSTDATPAPVPSIDPMDVTPPSGTAAWSRPPGEPSDGPDTDRVPVVEPVEDVGSDEVASASADDPEDPSDPGSASSTPIVPPIPNRTGTSGANFWSPHRSSPAGPPPTWVTPVTPRRDPSSGPDPSSGASDESSS